MPPGKKGAFLEGSLKSYAIQDHPLYEDAYEDLKERLREAHGLQADGNPEEGGEAEAPPRDEEEGGGAVEGEQEGDEKPKPKRPMSASSSRLKPKLEPLPTS